MRDLVALALIRGEDRGRQLGPKDTGELPAEVVAAKSVEVSELAPAVS